MTRKAESDYAAETFEERHRLRRYEEELKAKELLAREPKPEIEGNNGQTFSGSIGALMTTGKQKRYSWRTY